MKKEKLVEVFLLTIFMLMAIVPEAFAITAPVAGSFAYDVYDMAVNSILKGPIGFVAGWAQYASGRHWRFSKKSVGPSRRS